MTNVLPVPLLLTRCRAGDPAALDEFARRYGPEIERLALVVLAEDDSAGESAADAAQETLAAALENLHRFRGESDLRTWLFAIALNVCRKKLRRRRAQARMLDALRGLLRLHAPGPGELARAAETRLDVQSALARLDDKFRLPLVLRYAHSLRTAEIAQVLGLNENTVLSRLYQGREKLRRILESEEDDGR
jgi:RNA polymerase sigma-70 factor, ECF subfamily